jgi:hypothetical protein
VSISGCFVSEGQIIQPPAVTAGQIVAEGNIYPLFGGYLDNGHYDALLPVEEKVR